MTSNFIDKVIAYFSPIRAKERLKARMTMALAGSYVGASMARRQTAHWRTSYGDVDADILHDIPILRERSRDLNRNNPLACGAINTNIENVIGTGLKLQSRIDRDVLNLTEEQISELENKIEREFRLHFESHHCDITGTLNFYDIQELVFRQMLENGDVFILLPRIQQANHPYTLRLQIVEADRVCNPNNAPNSQTLAGGVEKNAYGMPIAYHILKHHPGVSYEAKQEWIRYPAFDEKTGLRNVIHLYRVLRPGQSRGVPYLAPVIEALKQIGDYTNSELMSALISSYYTVFIRSEMSEAHFVNESTMQSEEPMKLAPGSIIGLGPGEDITIANPTRPNTSFEPFLLALLRQIGVALEIPHEILIKHFTSSYSASRAAMLEAWRFFHSRRQWLARNFCQIVYEIWLYEAISSGRISAPGFFNNPIIRQAYCGAEWIGPGRGMIDELDEVKAAKERVELGITTLAEETAQLTGGDWERKHRQSVKEQRMRREAGLIVEEIKNKFSAEAEKKDRLNRHDRLEEQQIRMFKETKEIPIIIKNKPQDIHLNIKLKPEGGKVTKKTLFYNDIEGKPKKAEIIEEIQDAN